MFSPFHSYIVPEVLAVVSFQSVNKVDAIYLSALYTSKVTRHLVLEFLCCL